MSLPATYSKAFESFVEKPDDLPGLIAYALYKQNLREAAQSGRILPVGADREPTPSERQVYREAADRRLAEFADVAVREATPDIIEESIAGVISSSESRLRGVIREQTSMKNSIIANCVAWILTLAATIIVVQSVYLPNWQGHIAEKMRNSGEEGK